ncbi:flagellin [Exiguobacterium sp. TNDT2]|uniref:flagellin N-terminal helical domain-containing protein n=1 Tax=Exiguobacterium sp. TNDT2 TaxID=2233531 RepID=UPI000DEEC44D|nr:flagellin [Exiguobacterium sp. TNDT2]
MIINNNLNAMNAHRNMTFNSTQTGKSMEKLSSGLRINRAGDDAAGLAISEKMRGQIRGLDQASRNAQDGISLIQTAEGALNETHSILQRMRELATQAANDTNVGVDRNEIQKEMNTLTSEINRVGNTTEFNTQKLLNGGQSGTGALAAEKTAADNFTATDFSSIANAGIVLNGQAVGLDNLSALDATADIDAVATALQSDLDAVFDGSAHGGQQFTITKNTADTKLIITSVNTGVDAKVDLTGSTAAVTDALGFSDVSEVRGEGNEFTANFQIGANQGQSMTITVADMRAQALGLSGTASAAANGVGATNANATFGATVNVTNGTTNANSEAALDVSTHENATAAVEVINQAIERVSAERSQLGAFQNRLEHTISNLGNAGENLQAAESRIRDVDMAKEMMNFTKNNILNQASQAMLAQSKSQPEAVLQLLR